MLCSSHLTICIKVRLSPPLCCRCPLYTTSCAQCTACTSTEWCIVICSLSSLDGSMSSSNGSYWAWPRGLTPAQHAAATCVTPCAMLLLRSLSSTTLSTCMLVSLTRLVACICSSTTTSSCMLYTVLLQAFPTCFVAMYIIVNNNNNNAFQLMMS